MDRNIQINTGTPAKRVAAGVVMLLAALCFSTNLIFGRGVIGEVAPFTLAFIRWVVVAVCLAPFALRERERVVQLIRTAAPSIFLQGMLGMWICGAIVYMALAHTTATNATLIYTTSPAMIIGLEAIVGGRRIGRREIAGLVIAFAGVAVIVLKGDVAALLSLDLNLGDLLIAAAAFSWAIYSIRLNQVTFKAVSGPALFALISGAGALALLPFALVEYVTGQAMPVTLYAWQNIAGIVVFASLLAFSGFQYGVRVLGPSLSGIFMYLMPVYGVFLAVTFLGETFQPFHQLGIVLVLGGVVLSTFPTRIFRRR